MTAVDPAENALMSSGPLPALHTRRTLALMPRRSVIANWLKKSYREGFLAVSLLGDRVRQVERASVAVARARTSPWSGIATSF